MAQMMTMRQVEALTAQTVGKVPYARMWNVLTARVRAGQTITDNLTIAFIVGSVGIAPAKAMEMAALATQLFSTRA